MGPLERDEEVLPAPRRRVSPAEQALRRLRREVQPATSHSVRNTIILVAILVAATGLTVWMTQGVPTEDVPSAPAAALPVDDFPPGDDWESLRFDTGSANEGQEHWATGPRSSQATDLVRAPAVDAWPPHEQAGSHVLPPEQPFAAPPALSTHLPGERYVPSVPAAGPNAQREPAPVANLIHIEPPPVRR